MSSFAVVEDTNDFLHNEEGKDPAENPEANSQVVGVSCERKKREGKQLHIDSNENQENKISV